MSPPPGDQVGADAAGSFEHEVLGLLASGRLVDLQVLLDSSPRDDLFVALARADGRVRRLDIGLPELQLLVQRVDRACGVSGGADDPKGPRMDLSATGGAEGARLWMHAMLCERLLVDGDAAGFLIARAIVEQISADPLPPLVTLYCRARIKRVAASAWMLLPAGDESELHSLWRDDAIRDFLRCGFHEEIAVTRAVISGLRVTMSVENALEDFDRLLESRGALAGDDRSIWPAVIDYFMAMASFEVGAFDVLEQTLCRIEASSVLLPVVSVVPAYLRAALRLLVEGPTTEVMSDIEQALDRLADLHPRLLYIYQLHVANVLADFGSPLCHRYFDSSLDMPPMGPMTDIDRALCRMRQGLLRGIPHTADEIEPLLVDLSGMGHARHAARFAMRLAWHLELAGAHRDAHALQRWATDRLPPRERLVLFERLWLDRLPSAPDGSAGAGPEAAPDDGPPTDVASALLQGPAYVAAATAGMTGVAAGPGMVTAPRPADRLDRPGPHDTAVPGGSGAPAGEGPAKSPGPGDPSGRATTATGAGDARGVGVEIRVMGPTVEVRSGGVDVVVGETPAKLLLALVLAHPAPLHLEQACDLLWPDALMEQSRPRLNTVVHRLRRTLDPGRSLVHRVADRLGLDAEACSVDLWEYRRLFVGAEADPAQAQARAAALCAIRANLCDIQFPYEDRFADERRRFASDWLIHARRLLTGGDHAPGLVVPALSAMGYDPGDLGILG